MAALDNLQCNPLWLLQSKCIDFYPMQSYYTIVCIDFSGLGLE